MILSKKDKIICALDVKNAIEVMGLIREIDEYVGMYKVGLELFTAGGMGVLNRLESNLCNNANVFLDLKFHDIPNTVAKSIENFQRFSHIKMLTVHASGGDEMIKAAISAAGDTEIIAVTLLTSLKQKNSTKKVIELTDEALNAGASGVVCSAKEVKILRKKFGTDFKIIVPGIRPKGTDTHDQKRTGTPKQVLKDGADYLVIGRAITQSTNPKNAAKSILSEL